VELPKAPAAKADGTGSTSGTAISEALTKSKSPTAPLPEISPRANAQGPGVPAETADKLKGIIVDDDPLVRDILRDLLDASNEVLVVGEAGTVAQARLLTKQHAPQVVFLDINLPDTSGFDLLPDLKPGTLVVFVTSTEEYAVNAFDCQAADYLLKPVSPERLKQALARVRHRLAAKPATPPAATSGLSDSFLIKTLTETRLVKVGEIERIVAYGEYSWVYWRKNQKGALLRKSLKQWLSELPGKQFVRVHRRAIVNLACMERIERLPNGRVQVRLRDTAEPVLVSLRLAPALNRRLEGLRTQANKPE
jgi:two-component system, LytTR family, response regulator